MVGFPSRLLKKSASFVLASFRSSTYPRGYASRSALAAALLDGLLGQPAAIFSIGPFSQILRVYCA